MAEAMARATADADAEARAADAVRRLEDREAAIAQLRSARAGGGKEVQERAGAGRRPLAFWTRRVL